MIGRTRISRFPGRFAPGTSLLLAFVLLLATVPTPVAGQGLGSQGLGRGYWHMFLAYAVAWIVVMIWTVSIGRRLAEVERRLEE